MDGLSRAFAPDDLAHALCQVKVQSILCDLTEDGFDRAADEIAASELSNSDKGVRTVARLIVDVCDVRPLLISMFARFAKALDSRKSDKPLLETMRSVFLELDPAEMQVLRPITFLFECNECGYIGDQEIADVIEKFYNIFVARGYNVFSMLCWFGPILDRLCPELFRDHIARIQRYYTVHHGENSFFLEMFREMRKDNWKHHKEVVRGVYMPGTVGDIVRRDDIENFEKMANVPGFDVDQMVNKTVLEYCSIVWAGSQLIGFAAFHGARKVFESLVVRGADVTMVDANRQTLGNLAVAGGDLEIIGRCEAIGCGFEGSLEVSARAWRFDIFQWLLAKGNIDIKDTDVLHEAAHRNSIEVMLFCIERGCEVNKRDKFGETPLHKAASGGRTEAINILLLCIGIEVDSRDELGLTPFATCVQKGVRDAVLAFIQDGRCDINAKTVMGEYPLWLAVDEGFSHVAELLLSLDGIEIGEVPAERGSLLHTIVKEKYGSTLVKAVGKHKDIDVNKRDAHGMTPLHLLAQLNMSEKESTDTCAGVLELDGIDGTVRNNDGMTPFQCAAKECNVPIMDILVERGFNSNIATEDGKRALHIAVENGVLDSVRFLIGLECVDVNAVDSDGCTPLISAVTMDEPEITRALLNCPRVDLTICDAEGKTAYERATDDAGECLEVFNRFLSSKV